MVQLICKSALEAHATGIILLAVFLPCCAIQPVLCVSVDTFEQERNAGYRDLISKEYSTAEQHYRKALQLSKAIPEAPYKVALLNAEYADLLARTERHDESASAYRKAITIAEEWMRSASQEERFGFDRDLIGMKRRLALISTTTTPSLQRKPEDNDDTGKVHATTKPVGRSRISIVEQLHIAKKLAHQEKPLVAIRILQKAIIECKSDMGAGGEKPTWQNHRVLLKCLDELGRQFLNVNQLPQAKDVLLNSYRIKRKLLWTGFPSLVETTSLLGITAARLDEREDARRLLESALQYKDRLDQVDRENAYFYLLVLTERDGRLADAHSLLANYIELTIPVQATPERRYDLLSALASRLVQDNAPNLGAFCARRATIALKKMEKRGDQEDQFANQLTRADSLLRANRFAEGEAICLELRDTSTNNPRYRAACYRLLAFAQFQLHKYDQAHTTVTKALELNEAVLKTDPAAYEETVLYAMRIAEARSDMISLEKLLDQLSANVKKENLSMAKSKANLYATLALNEWQQHKFEKAQKHFSEAFSQWTILPLELRAGLGIQIGDIAMTMQQPLKAVTCYRECQKAPAAVPKHISSRAFLWRLGFALTSLERWRESLSPLKKTLAETAEANDVDLEMKALCTLCEAYIATQQYADAKRLIEVYTRKSDSSISKAIQLYVDGQLMLKDGKSEVGRRSLREAAALFARQRDQFAVKEAACFMILAGSYSESKDLRMHYLQKAVSAYQQQNVDQGEALAETYLEFGKLCRELKRDSDAATAFNTASKAIEYSDSPSTLDLKSQLRILRVPEGRR